MQKSLVYYRIQISYWHSRVNNKNNCLKIFFCFFVYLLFENVPTFFFQALHMYAIYIFPQHICTLHLGAQSLHVISQDTKKYYHFDLEM